MKNLIRKSAQLVGVISIAVITTLLCNVIVSTLICLIANGNFSNVFHSVGMAIVSTLFFLMYTILLFVALNEKSL